MGSSFRWNDGGGGSPQLECPSISGLGPGLRRDDEQSNFKMGSSFRWNDGEAG